MVDPGGSVVVGTEAADLKITLIGDGLCRIYLTDVGNVSRGRYVDVPYEDVRDYVVSRRPRSELIDLYFQEVEEH